jgi:hypothetical protein
MDETRVPFLVKQCNMDQEEYERCLHNFEKKKKNIITKLGEEYLTYNEMDDFKNAQKELKCSDKKMQKSYSKWIEENNRIYKNNKIFTNKGCTKTLFVGNEPENELESETNPEPALLC